ncbi:2-amino-4-oxopentanoate thiolase subunit OrtA [Paramaledivibacter caminithermalis]|jgi:hypothetical protein|uniref:2-amino-4-ketopentanoate thiolase alpha subunit n=1 Tax=Paramaledivibacter caminithermalis (strain DSM 15212 / CIP 107654 / DViRD3) TaxID=1121301 RepID=A0A1M6QPZ8_PARC5|nr:2-amino-4-oxopentanoate thiolase subunit OrtA [Paramaledivibacter caminithermalis]SHK22362.1 hypothetical protein SAMN02745912_02673 [Paramaledivibacter caminithermalis DSM 15212]
MKKAIKGSWVEIENVVLPADSRAPQVPKDTKKTPLKMWTRGVLINDEAEIGETVRVNTLSGRIAEGKLVDIKPRYAHDFGYPVIELIETGLALKEDIGGK